MLAKLFPTNIAERSWSGLFKRSKALLALVLDFFDKFLNLILFAAIIPVSEPEKNPLRINKNINVEKRTINEGSSCITNQPNMSSCNTHLGQPTLIQIGFLLHI